MAQNSAQQLLPIKVVFPSEGDYFNPEGGGGGTTIFGDVVTLEMRQHFNTQLSAVEEHFAASFQSEPGVPAVAVVTLKREALAKSHRPLDLFNDDTCPIIGANKAGELYVSATPQGLARVRERMLRDSKSATANVSTLEEILPFTDLNALAAFGESADELAEESVRLRLFNFRREDANRNAVAALERIVGELDLEVEELHYADGLKVFRIKANENQERVSSRVVAALASFKGTQSIGPFPKYNLVRTQAHIHGNLTPSRFPAPERGREYGIVGIIDSGTDPNNILLRPWVVGRLKLHPREFQDNDHGSFVAGLIANCRALNHGDLRFPTAACKIVDVVAFDSSGEADEDDLIFAIDEGIREFPDVKVWNLSLALTGPTCNDNEFSLFGAALDERTRQHGILFVVAAGNYDVQPYRTWPANPIGDDGDRICPPADALSALTVGARAHLDLASSRVRMEEPSPFSRRGPGPGYIMKPEVSHWGGNCNANGDYLQTGVVSLDGNGHLVENVGTSFAAPLVSAIAGAARHELTGSSGPSDPPTSALLKALTVHSAFLKSAPMPFPIYSQYVGVGVPGDVSDLVACTQSSATLILKIPVTPTPHFNKDPFPMPPCLSASGTFKAEIFMTLIYEPPVDRDFGFEYCRVNVRATLGTMREKGYHAELHPYPNWDTSDGYWEEDKIRNGYKWAPLKFYYRKFTRGPVGLDWRLSLFQLNRSQFTMGESQDVTLIITIRAAEAGAPVYNELMEAINQLNWTNQDLAVRTQNRLRI